MFINVYMLGNDLEWITVDSAEKFLQAPTLAGKLQESNGFIFF